jgi:hypothetical protein
MRAGRVVLAFEEAERAVVSFRLLFENLSRLSDK